MNASAAGSSSKLYTPQMLALSTDLAQYPLLETHSRFAEARSRTCGSTIALGVDLDGNGLVTRIGVQISACAVGQSSAAIMASGINGAGLAEVQDTHGEITAWLEGQGDLPHWPGLDVIEPARAHPGRHGALLLPWNAAIEALSSPAHSG